MERRWTPRTRAAEARPAFLHEDRDCGTGQRPRCLCGRCLLDLPSRLRRPRCDLCVADVSSPPTQTRPHPGHGVGGDTGDRPTRGRDGGQARTRTPPGASGPLLGAEPSWGGETRPLTAWHRAARPPFPQFIALLHAVGQTPGLKAAALRFPGGSDLCRAGDTRQGELPGGPRTREERRGGPARHRPGCACPAARRWP